VLQVVSITALVGYLSYRSGQQAIEDLAHQLATETGYRITEKLNGYLHTAHQLNGLQIAAMESGAVSLDDLDQLQQFLIKQHHHMPEIKTLGFGSADGTFLTSHRVSRADFETGMTSLAPTDIPFEAGRSNPDDHRQFNLYAIDRSGHLQRPVETIANLDVYHRPWYQQAVSTRQPGWTEPFQLGRTDLLTISAYTPVVDGADQLLGVFFANISLEQLNQFLAQLTIGQTGEVFIVERNGALIANSAGDPAYIASVPNRQKPVAADGSPLVTYSGNVDFRRLMALESSDPLIRNGAQQLQQYLENWNTLPSPKQLAVSIDGKRHFLQAIPYQDDYGLNWLIVTIIPASDFMAEIEANRQRTIAISIGALMASIGLGVWGTRRLVRPIWALNQATEDLAAGNLVPQTQSTAILEVEALRLAFHQMAHRLDDSFQVIKTSQQQFATLLENVPVGVAVFDREGKLIWLNPISRQLLREDALGTESSHLSVAFQIYKADTDQLYPVDQLPAVQALGGETITVSDIEMISLATGQRIPLEAHGAPVFDADGNIVYAIVAFQDISERREVERLTTRYQKELEREVALKTA
jgi:PAS domain-containing protein